MLGKLVEILLSILMLLGWLVGEPASPVIPISQGVAEGDGAVVRLVEATAADVESLQDVFEVGTVVEIENTSDVPLMQVVYTVSLLDENGEVLRSYGETYTATDGAIEPGEKRVDVQQGCRWKDDGSPISLAIGIGTVSTIEEMPPVHLPERGEPLYAALGDEHLANIANEPPVSITVGIDQGGYLREAVYDTPDGVARMVGLFCKARIGAPTEEWVTDNYNYIWFEWADGTGSGISINLANLEFSAYGTYYMYELEDLGEFWSQAESDAVEVEYRGDDA